MHVIQTLLRHKDTAKVTFLPVDTRVKEGTVLSLQDDPRHWTVEKQYMQQDVASIQRLWGLDLPKSARTEA